MKLLNRLSLIFLSVISIFIFYKPSYADENEDLKEYVSAVQILLDKNRDRFSKENIKELENWLRQERLKLEDIKDKKEEKKLSLDDRISQEILKNVEKRSSSFVINVGDYFSEDDLLKLFEKDIRKDDYFYYAIYKSADISTSYYENTDASGKKYIESFTFNMTYRQSRQEEKEIDDFVNKWVGQNISEDMSQVEKAKKIHDFIATKNKYNPGDKNAKSGGYSIYSPASILFGQGGVCNAYATLFDKMAKKAGLKTYYATGQIREDGQLHIWNMVQIGDKWYNLDVTWDDPILNSDKKILNEDDFVSYDYFLVSDKKVLESRTIDKDDLRPIAFEGFNHNFKETDLKFADSLSYEFKVYKKTGNIRFL